MFPAAPVTATLMPANSGASSRLITCASFYSAHAHSDGTGDEPKLVGEMSFKFTTEGVASRRYVDLEESVKGVTNEGFQRERSADEIIGANGLLCMRGSSFSPFVSSN